MRQASRPAGRCHHAERNAVLRQRWCRGGCAASALARSIRTCPGRVEPRGQAAFGALPPLIVLGLGREGDAAADDTREGRAVGDGRVITGQDGPAPSSGRIPALRLSADRETTVRGPIKMYLKTTSTTWALRRLPRFRTRFRVTHPAVYLSRPRQGTTANTQRPRTERRRVGSTPVGRPRWYGGSARSAWAGAFRGRGGVVGAKTRRPPGLVRRVRPGAAVMNAQHGPTA